MSERFMVFVVNIIKLEKLLCKTYSGRHIMDNFFVLEHPQAANYERSKGRRSRADFIHKMQIVLKRTSGIAFLDKIYYCS